MNITDNPELKRKILDSMAYKYHIKEMREGVHLSTIIYCLTRSQFDNSPQRAEVTDDEVMLFCLGYGLQDILTPESASTPVIEKDGVMYSPDFTLPASKDEPFLNELKTTRKSAKSGETRDFPETWIEYMKGGCCITNSKVYDLAVLYMMGNYHPPTPILSAFRFEFTEDEILDNWSYLMERKEVYLSHDLSKGQLIMPFKYCKSWECQFCRYKLICEHLTHQEIH